MHMVGIARKGQQKPASRLDDQMRSVENDFAAFECIIQVIDRGHVAMGRVIGDPLTLFVLPTIVRMTVVMPSRTHRGEDHRLRIERLGGSQLIADIAQTFFDETRHNFGGVLRITKQRPIDDRMSRLIPHFCQMDVSIVHRHQPTAILGTKRVCGLNYHS